MYTLLANTINSIQRAAPAFPIVTTNLRSYLDFSNTDCYTGSGTAINDLYNSDPYTVFGPTFSNTYGGEFYFDGSNDYIRSNSLATTQGDISVGVWFRRDGIIANTNMSLWNTESSNGNGYRHLLDENGGSYYLRARINNTNTDYLTPTADQTWFYYVATYNETTDDVKLYLNGSLVASGTYVGQLSVSNEYLMIGASSLGGSTGATQRFRGYIGEVHLYTGELTASEVTQNWNGTKTRYGY